MIQPYDISRDEDFGTIVVKIDEVRKERGLSISKLSYLTELQRTQIRDYINNKKQRLDVTILAKLCYVLRCDISDLIEYIPPKKDQKK